VLDYLPERDRPRIKRRLRRAWAEADHGQALEQLLAIAAELDRSHSGAAASLREGVEDTLTLTRRMPCSGAAEHDSQTADQDVVEHRLSGDGHLASSPVRAASLLKTAGMDG
jgi:hypothetical protein